MVDIILTTDTNLLDLMTWLSPSFPVGGYAYSHAIEYTVEDARIKDETHLTNWISAALLQGSGRVDGVLFKAIWQAITDGDTAALNFAIERSDVMRGTMEMALESAAQGQAFISTVLQTRDFPELIEITEQAKSDGRDITYAAAVACVAALAKVPLREALLAYFHAFSANLVSAGVRLVPLGQIAGQRTQEALKPVIVEAVEAALATDIDQIAENLGTAAFLIDWASMKHETQYTRLFRS